MALSKEINNLPRSDPRFARTAFRSLRPIHAQAINSCQCGAVIESLSFSHSFGFPRHSMDIGPTPRLGAVRSMNRGGKAPISRPCPRVSPSESTSLYAATEHRTFVRCMAGSVLI